VIWIEIFFLIREKRKDGLSFQDHKDYNSLAGGAGEEVNTTISMIQNLAGLKDD